jgi:hypothetical protein
MSEKGRIRVTTAAGQKVSLMTGLEGEGRATSLKPAITNMDMVPV